MVDGLNVPVDAVLAEEPLEPQRPVARHPSLVGEAERRLLAATPGVRLHVVPGTGHNVMGQAITAAAEIVLEACHRASAQLSAARRRLDEPLLEATPLAARRVLHWGPEGQAFADAFQQLNPKAQVTVLGGDPPDGETSTPSWRHGRRRRRRWRGSPGRSVLAAISSPAGRRTTRPWRRS